MSTLKDFLPAPTDGLPVPQDDSPEKPETLTVVLAPSQSPGLSGVIASKQADDDAPDYSAVVKQGENASRIVHSRYDAMVEKPRSEVLQSLPTEAEIAETTRQTKAALEGVLSTKLNASTSNKRRENPKFIRYTPANASAASQQRIIKMVQAPRDPMEPPRFTQRKAPVNPPSPPAPVMHSPERKLSKEEAAEWKIPPVVSDWKNNRGYTISLDKRLAADGRTLVDRSINDRFAHMAEALYQAEKNARADVEKRAALQMQVSVRAKAARERELRQLAEKARKERREFLGLSERTDTESVAGGDVDDLRGVQADTEVQVEDEPPPSLQEIQGSVAQPQISTTRRKRSRFSNRNPASTDTDAVNTNGRLTADERRRNEVRRERRLDREREMRLREAHGDEAGRQTLKRSKLTRDLDRDVSEQAALGQSVNKAPRGELLYDERLFNQDGGGMSMRGRASLGGSYGADDSYNLYEEPLFKGSSLLASAGNLHVRGNKTGGQDDTKTNAKETAAASAGRVRDGPVEFERDGGLGSAALESEDDPYGLNQFLEAAE